MSGSPEYLKINNHIFPVDGITTVSSYYNPVAPVRYEILINYNVGASVCLVFDSEEESKRAFEKISESLKAK